MPPGRTRAPRLGVTHVLGRRVAAGDHFHAAPAVGLEFGEQRELFVGRETVTRRVRDHRHAAGFGDPSIAFFSDAQRCGT